MHHTTTHSHPGPHPSSAATSTPAPTNSPTSENSSTRSPPDLIKTLTLSSSSAAVNSALTATSTPHPTSPSPPIPPGSVASPSPTPPRRRSPARNDWPWRELDSAVSSDALLMNIFCHPRVFNGRTLAPAVANLLNVDRTAQPRFGITPGVPLKTIRKRRTTRNAQTLPDHTLKDRTEIDLQLGNLFVEAKLTESSFQTAAPRLIERYRDLETVFDPDRLPRKTLYTPAIASTRRRLLPTRRTHLIIYSIPTPNQIRPHRHRRLPTHPQRPRRLRRRSILLRPLRRPPSRPHRNLVLHPLRRPLPHLRHPPETPHLAGTSHHPPPGPPTIPRSKIRNPSHRFPLIPQNNSVHS